MVAKAVAATQRGDLDKVVLSRLMDIVTEQPVDIAALMGASPELMLRKQGRDFSSCPLLAGSARRDADAQRGCAAGDSLMHSAKDRHEHKLVTDAMRDVLQPRSQISRAMRIVRCSTICGV